MAHGEDIEYCENCGSILENLYECQNCGSILENLYECQNCGTLTDLGEYEENHKDEEE